MTLFGNDRYADGKVYVKRRDSQGREATETDVLGESLARWQREIQHIRAAVHLWDLIGPNEQDPNIKELKRIIIQRGGVVRFEHHGAPEGIIAAPGYQDEFLRGGKRQTDVVGAAKRFLVALVNSNLHRTASPQLTIVGLSQAEEFRTTISPRNLLGAMWLMLFLEISEKRVIKKCPECDTWFDATRNPTRLIYCRTHGAGCRKKASRRRLKDKGLLE